VPRELNVLALIKGEERYVYVYDDASHLPLLDVFEAHAADEGLSLNWFDAATLAQKAREQVTGQCTTPRRIPREYQEDPS
jgi:hypothetical protein